MRRVRRKLLGVRGYDALQNWVHRGHRETVQVIVEMLEAETDDSVVEIGCGTGALARQFIARGFDYWGVDPDAARIAAARRLGGGRFLVGEAEVLEGEALPAKRHVFIHGVLHHLDDEHCRKLLHYLFGMDSRGRVVVSEPVRPDRWWTNPAGELLGRMDEGRHVRRMQEWLDLFGPTVDRVNLRRLWPRWPVNILDVRVQAPRNGAVAGGAMAAATSGA